MSPLMSGVQGLYRLGAMRRGEHVNALHVYALPPKFIKIQLQSCPILSKANSCRDFLSRIFQEITLRKPLPPAPHRGTQLIYVAGGYRQHSLSSMEAYDPGRNVWLKLADMDSPCSCLGSCVLFGLLHTPCFLRTHAHTLLFTALYDPEANCWVFVSPVSVARLGAGVAGRGGSLYVVGGGC
ncbi:kelch-like ECH-associated protein 1A [Oncorhynchus clarkii lewisi]|uniref:kelch-like ECH-associated protein 1A n=1 Tax=Oncorhynchus clarkii lewisi TaxID=490388 RepID=UPI0039B96B1C